MKCTAVLFTLLALAGKTAFAQHASLAITHVTIIDVQAGTLQKDRTVLVSQGRIVKITPTGKKAPAATRIVDATDKFLIPGLWDSHVHALWDSTRPAWFFPLLIANGVTSVREMGGPMSITDQVNWRDLISSGSYLGPGLEVPGPFVDGPRPTWPGSVAVPDSTRAKQVVDSLKAAGVDFIKVYSGIPRAAYFSLAAEARKEALPFEGHLPLEVTAEEASDAGQKSIEHLMGILMGCSSQGADIQQQLMRGVNINTLTDLLITTYDSAKAAALFTHFVRNGTWQVPTLTIRRARPYLQELLKANDPRLQYIPKSIVAGWMPKNDGRQPVTPAAIAARKRMFGKELQVVRAMHKAGVRFLAGTDAPNPFCFPGFSIHDELALFVQAGFSPLEALQTATINPAQFWALDHDLGTICQGKIANMILLDANPLSDISNTQRITAVILRGQLVTNEKIRSLLRICKNRH